MTRSFEGISDTPRGSAGSTEGHGCEDLPHGSTGQRRAYRTRIPTGTTLGGAMAMAPIAAPPMVAVKTPSL